jgi:hypothetical protein
MARPRKPTAELERKGAFKHDPQRRRARQNEPIPSGELGDPPYHLRIAEKRAWVELAAHAPPGVMKNSDRLLLEITCGLMAKLRDRNPMRGGLKAAELALLIQCLSRMGLTPSDRSKVGVPEQPPANPFSEFVTGEAVRPN